MSNVVVSENQNVSIDQAVDLLLKIIEDLLVKDKKEFVTIGLTGGSLIKLLSSACIKRKQEFQKYSDKLKFLFGDERFVPFDDPECTYKCYVDMKFFEELNIKPENVYAIKADAENVTECAADYEKRLKPLLNEKNGFDILLLGMGPDGHICSLFPNHKLFTEKQTSLVVPISDSPKPPPQRVTLTMPFINNSSNVFFCSYGASKADILKRILSDKDQSLPAACVKANGTLKWFLDKDAASLL